MNKTDKNPSLLDVLFSGERDLISPIKKKQSMLHGESAKEKTKPGKGVRSDCVCLDGVVTEGAPRRSCLQGRSKASEHGVEGELFGQTEKQVQRPQGRTLALKLP